MEYNPYPYQPLMQHFYQGTQHMNAVADFNRWLKNRFPLVHASIEGRRPDLLDAVGTVRGGRLNGLGQDPVYEYQADSYFGTPMQPAQTPSVISSWGKDILDLGKGLIAVKSQNDLIRLNVSRAERGLSPIDPGSVAPQVNVGLSSGVQNLAMFAVLGLVGVAGLAMLSKRRR